MLYFRQYRFDLASLSLYREEEQIALRPKVAQLLSYFLTHPNQTVTREALLSALWQHGEFREAALTQSITELRQALNDSAQQPIFIKTVPQQGYHWICPVENRIKRRVDLLNKAKWASILMVLFIVGGVGVKTLFTEEQIPYQSVNKRRLIIFPLQNETGVDANTWWGYALEASLREQLHDQFQLMPKSQNAEFETEKNTDKLTLKLKPMQQRFVLEAHYGNQTLQLVVEQLDEQFPSVANQLIIQLKMRKQPNDNTDTPQNQGMSDYYRGVQALMEHGPKLAKAYFDAALLQMPDHLPSQLELAQLSWQLGEIEEAERRFAEISLTSAKVATQARFHLYYGEFYKAQGQFTKALSQADQALLSAQRSQQVELIAMAYQLQADLYWTLQRWEAYQRAMNAAHTLIGSRSFAFSEAQRSFYLANPPAAGPMEKTLLNLQKSRPVLEQAIAYYQQTGQTMSLIQALFAYGQNYLVPVAITEPSLLRALTLAKQGGYEFLEQQILSYLGFYYIQLHQGQTALQYLTQKPIDKRFLPNYEQRHLLIAMAYMDMALQSGDTEALQQAITAYQTLLDSDYLSPVTRANVKLLYAWTWLKAGNISAAEQLTQQAFEAYQQLQLGEVEIYAQYTQMYIHLLKNEPEQAILLMPAHSQSQLVLLYGAVAAQMNHEEELKKQLVAQLADLRNSALLITQLQQLEQQSAATPSVISGLIDAPYSVYCQSKWTIN
ncbi:winged helix-turn-helix domain-containing protein [Pseudoalteromonas xiamenensis]|uniref:winged helix-turn-helix domain-containing protein n=1 Tax=Pseudoalteromonas xiamenensis TaxID=882626 RepID=UPI0027E50C2A|nr:winged helix-turn-helix domain-containing protein [Pseudoalteromonas xiamenensis]WMN58625.1 winged helix-turn-helix domain-containing protein [Pseudoalteromonas xiamenensis]